MDICGFDDLRPVRHISVEHLRKLFRGGHQWYFVSADVILLLGCDPACPVLNLGPQPGAFAPIEMRDPHLPI